MSVDKHFDVGIGTRTRGTGHRQEECILQFLSFSVFLLPRGKPLVCSSIIQEMLIWIWAKRIQQKYRLLSKAIVLLSISLQAQRQPMLCANTLILPDECHCLHAGL